MRNSINIYLFKGKVPKEFPFIHDSVRNDCLVVEVHWNIKVSNEFINKEVKRIVNGLSCWYKSYIVY